VYTNKYNISNKQFIQTETVNSQYKMHSKTLWTQNKYAVYSFWWLPTWSSLVSSSVYSFILTCPLRAPW